MTDNLFFSSRIQSIQSQMTTRALELLALPPDQSAFILDIGCGSGLSGELLDEEGHVWVGVDVAPSMLGETLPPVDDVKGKKGLTTYRGCAGKRG